MADEPAYLMKFRELVKANPEFTHLEELERELYSNPSDRATAVMFGSFVETSLKGLLETQLRENLNSDERRSVWGFEGVLGTLGAKTIMAYALGLIGEITFSDLTLLRHLRNGFAHSRVPLSFKTDEIREMCSRLRIVDLEGSYIPYGFLSRAPNDALAEASDINDPKTRYISTCHNLSFRMLQFRDSNGGSGALP
jgi:hypothetical protein